MTSIKVSKQNTPFLFSCFKFSVNPDMVPTCLTIYMSQVGPTERSCPAPEDSKIHMEKSLQQDVYEACRIR